jgi:hypothetical protein
MRDRRLVGIDLGITSVHTVRVLAGDGAVVCPARVNLPEADFLRNHCVVVVSSFGSLIHTAVGSDGGSGGLPTKRSGWAA